MLSRSLARSVAGAGSRASIARNAFSTSAIASSSSSSSPSGNFLRPREAPSNAGLPLSAQHQSRPPVAQPHTPPHIPAEQSPNYPSTWSNGQNPRENAMRGPRFEQTNVDFQPQPLSAMEMIQREPIRLVEARIASCDGGDGPLGHPKVFINLDKPGPKACPYCGIRFERDHGHAHAHH